MQKAVAGGKDGKEKYFQETILVSVVYRSPIGRVLRLEGGRGGAQVLQGSYLYSK